MIETLNLKLKIPEANDAVDNPFYFKDALTKLDEELANPEIKNLTHAKVGTVHNLTGAIPTTGIITIRFKATANYTEGDMATINGVNYVLKPTGEETVLPDKAFVTGDIVSCEVDTVGKKINFKLGGAGFPKTWQDKRIAECAEDIPKNSAVVVSRLPSITEGIKPIPYDKVILSPVVDISPGSDVAEMYFSGNKSTMILTLSVAPFFMVYKMLNGVYTKMPNPDIPLAVKPSAVLINSLGSEVFFEVQSGARYIKKYFISQEQNTIIKAIWADTPITDYVLEGAKFSANEGCVVVNAYCQWGKTGVLLLEYKDNAFKIVSGIAAPMPYGDLPYAAPYVFDIINKNGTIYVPFMWDCRTSSSNNEINSEVYKLVNGAFVKLNLIIKRSYLSDYGEMPRLGFRKISDDYMMFFANCPKSISYNEVSCFKITTDDKLQKITTPLFQVGIYTMCNYGNLIAVGSSDVTVGIKLLQLDGDIINTLPSPNPNVLTGNLEFFGGTNTFLSSGCLGTSAIYYDINPRDKINLLNTKKMYDIQHGIPGGIGISLEAKQKGEQCKTNLFSPINKALGGLY